MLELCNLFIKEMSCHKEVFRAQQPGFGIYRAAQLRIMDERVLRTSCRCWHREYNRHMRRVYLDNYATTAVLPEVLEAMRPYFGEHFGNASSIHHHGQETRAAVERARESVANLLGCRPA